MSERTFTVLVKSPRKKHALSLPCSGETPYDGCDALEAMRSYAKHRPGVETMARTENKYVAEGFELLTLGEMETLFGEDTDARKPWERRIKH